MSVRNSLLAILQQGPCYGYQLRSEFSRRTGHTWPLNVGQIYNTLERLERDGLVTRGVADDHGHVYWHISDAGAREVTDWLSSPTERAQPSRDELAMKLAIAATLPGVDGGAIVNAQITASQHHRDELQRARDAATASDSDGFAQRIVLEARVLAANAEVHWLESLAQMLREPGSTPLEWGLDDERPKRGRPPQRRSSATPQP